MLPLPRSSVATKIQSLVTRRRTVAKEDRKKKFFDSPPTKKRAPNSAGRFAGPPRGEAEHGVSEEKLDEDDDVEARRAIKKEEEEQEGPAKGTAMTGGGRAEGTEGRGTRSDRDVRSDLVGESNLAK